jgi:hypothetical protein
MLVAAMIVGLSDEVMGLLHYYLECRYSHCPFSIAVSAATALDLMELHPFTIKSSLAIDSLDKEEAPGSC